MRSSWSNGVACSLRDLGIAIRYFDSGLILGRYDRRRLVKQGAAVPAGGGWRLAVLSTLRFDLMRGIGSVAMVPVATDRCRNCIARSNSDQRPPGRHLRVRLLPPAPYQQAATHSMVDPKRMLDRIRLPSPLSNPQWPDVGRSAAGITLILRHMPTVALMADRCYIGTRWRPSFTTSGT